jgi:hypothetical protein
MYKEILRSIGGIDAYPVVSLIIFVTFFAIVLARVCRMDAARVGRLASLPLDGTSGMHGEIERDAAAGVEVSR